MTVRDELVELIRSLPDMPGHRWADACAHFIDDHGPALLAMMEGHLRYEAVRKMNPPTFTKVFNESVTTGVPFDTLVDTWAFNNGYPSAIDEARAGK